MATLFAACVAIVPNPKDVLAVPPFSATQVDPLPTIKLPSVVAKAPIAVKLALDALLHLVVFECLNLHH